MLSVAVDTVKQKCFQAAFEHFGRARCGSGHQPAADSMHEEQKLKKPGRHINCWCVEQCIAVRGGMQGSQWRNVPCQQCMLAPEQRMTCGPANTTCSQFSGRLAANASLSELVSCGRMARDREQDAPQQQQQQHSLEQCKCWGQKTC